MIAQIPHLLRLKSYKTVAQLVNSHIKHPLLQQALSIHPLLVGEIRSAQPLSMRLSIILSANGAYFSVWAEQAGWCMSWNS